jgi:hypothetical protein
MTMATLGRFSTFVDRYDVDISEYNPMFKDDNEWNRVGTGKWETDWWQQPRTRPLSLIHSSKNNIRGGRN